MFENSNNIDNVVEPYHHLTNPLRETTSNHQHQPLNHLIIITNQLQVCRIKRFYPQ